MKIPVLIVDTPNANHRVYPREVMNRMIEDARDRIREDKLFVVRKQPESTTVDLNEVIGTIKNIEIEDNKVFVSVSFFPQCFSAGRQIEEGKLHLRTSGLGTLTEQPDGTFRVSNDYELISCFLTDDPA